MSLSFERTGRGKPLVLLHGLGGSRVIWQPVIPRLAAERDVVAPDLPGFGLSPASPEFVPSAVNLAEAVMELCAGLGIERPHTAGNSLGAWVALEMAKRGRAVSVCALSPAGLWRNPLGPRRYEPWVIGNRIRPLVQVLLRTRRGRTWLLQQNLARPEAVPADVAVELVRDYLGASGYRETNRLMRAGAFEHEGAVDVPVTIAWGNEDRIVGHPSSSRLPTGVEVILKPGWGHTPTWDDPHGVADLILESSST